MISSNKLYEADLEQEENKDLAVWMQSLKQNTSAKPDASKPKHQAANRNHTTGMSMGVNSPDGAAPLGHEQVSPQKSFNLNQHLNITDGVQTILDKSDAHDFDIFGLVNATFENELVVYTTYILDKEDYF